MSLCHCLLQNFPDKILTAGPQPQRTRTLPNIHSSQSRSRSRNKTEQSIVKLRFITIFLGGERTRLVGAKSNALTHLQSATMTNRLHTLVACLVYLLTAASVSESGLALTFAVVAGHSSSISVVFASSNLACVAAHCSRLRNFCVAISSERLMATERTPLEWKGFPGKWPRIVSSFKMLSTACGETLERSFVDWSASAVAFTFATIASLCCFTSISLSDRWTSSKSSATSLNSLSVRGICGSCVPFASGVEAVLGAPPLALSDDGFR